MLLCITPQYVRAEDSLSVTVTPPLFQLTIGPGESWASTLKIVNNNTYDVTYYTQLVDMQANGEEGRSKFTPLISEDHDLAASASSLAHWIRISSDPILVKAGTSEDVPFSVEIPQNAEPGGHYAAMLVGTQPGGLHATGTMLKVSSYVSSLLFVRIKGDIVESGRIREFLTSKELYQTPNVDFLLRFENMGNTHIQPQGDISIYNMWGKERGKVYINQDSNFGNVLPKSIRRFEFSWAGEQNLFDIGLYSAVVTLTYGENGKQNVTAKNYFWVIPVVPVLISVSLITLFLVSFIWFIRRYIRRALELEQKRMALIPTVQQPPTTIAKTLMEPIREGVIDLRNATVYKPSGEQSAPLLQAQRLKTTTQFLRKYRLFGIFVALLLVAIISIWFYFSRVLVGTRGFQITDVHIQEEVPSANTTQKP